MWLLVVLLSILLIVIYYLYLKNKRIKVDENAIEFYKKKEFFLNKTEKTAYDFMLNFFKNNQLNLTVFPKVKLTDFLWAPKQNRNAYLKIQNRFVDFLVVDYPMLHPVCAIFIVNKENKSKMDSLPIIEDALKKAQIKLVKIDTHEIFNGSFLQKIKQEVKNGG